LVAFAAAGAAPRQTGTIVEGLGRRRGVHAGGDAELLGKARLVFGEWHGGWGEQTCQENIEDPDAGPHPHAPFWPS
jgi:hypothetical protein